MHPSSAWRCGRLMHRCGACGKNRVAHALHGTANASMHRRARSRNRRVRLGIGRSARDAQALRLVRRHAHDEVLRSLYEQRRLGF
ncbi:hypothetical protein WS86_15435 [Burkholderia savannae]|nr:hypothetical protein WS86_15435 [Burkholderia savannae]